MHPELFTIRSSSPSVPSTSGRSPSTRTACLLAASYLLGLRLAMWRAKKWGLDAQRVLDLGHLHHHRRPRRREAPAGRRRLRPVRKPGDLLTLARSGGVFYGGLLFAVGVAFWYIATHRLPFWTTCDVFAPGIALGHVTGRLGCLAAGCCYGKPTDVPWAIVFTNPLLPRQRRDAARHPAASDADRRAGAALLILGLLLVHRAPRAAVPRRTFWAYIFSTPSRATSSRSIAATRAARCSASGRPRSSSRCCSCR